MTDHQKVAIIIPSLNSPMIGEVVDRILDQECPFPKEIIVVGQDKMGILQDYLKDIIFINTPEPINAAAARNLGIKSSKADYLLFLDADCLAEPGWIMKMVSKLQEGWDAVGGGVKFDQKPYWALVYNLSMFHEFMWTQNERQADYLPTLNLAVKKETIDQVGVLDESLQRVQDIDWTRRMVAAKCKLFFYPNAGIIHKPTISSIKSLWRQHYKNGYFSYQVRCKFQKRFSNGFFRSSLFWIIFSPLIGLIVSLRIYFRSIKNLKYITSFPGLVISKMSWCFGAAAMARQMRRSGS